jgi:hypothetical protein
MCGVSPSGLEWIPLLSPNEKKRQISYQAKLAAGGS